VKKPEILKQIGSIGVVPVLRARKPGEAIEIAGLIKEGGIPLLEITMTVPGAVGVIEKLAQQYGDEVLIGAGTVLDAETARACILAGAQFVVSPALELKTIELCRRYSVAIFPGALTPTEVVAAWQAGADAVKIFPCSAMGGAKYLKDLNAPLPQVEMIPTGGVSLTTATDFIKAGAFALGVGADLADVDALQRGEGESVVRKAQEYRRIVAAARSIEMHA
jgi:2-dehydro-3-deoxyphosphogluconate aldolase / (4S)-4-hydroxy-2-oxoglutarate aldolase